MQKWSQKHSKTTSQPAPTSSSKPRSSISTSSCCMFRTFFAFDFCDADAETVGIAESAGRVFQGEGSKSSKAWPKRRSSDLLGRSPSVFLGGKCRDESWGGENQKIAMLQDSHERFKMWKSNLPCIDTTLLRVAYKIWRTSSHRFSWSQTVLAGNERLSVVKGVDNGNPTLSAQHPYTKYLSKPPFCRKPSVKVFCKSSGKVLCETHLSRRSGRFSWARRTFKDFSKFWKKLPEAILRGFILSDSEHHLTLGKQMYGTYTLCMSRKSAGLVGACWLKHHNYSIHDLPNLEVLESVQKQVVRFLSEFGCDRHIRHHINSPADNQLAH